MKQRFAMALVGLVISGVVAGAGTGRSISIPPGWSAGYPDKVYAFGSDAFAVVAFKYKLNDPSSVFERSLVIQSTFDRELRTTEIAGKVFHLEYSPQDRGFLIAHRVRNDLGPRQIETYLLDRDGNIAWSRTGTRTLSFSADGSVLYAFDRGELFGGGTEVEILDLKGTSQKTLSFDASIRGIFMPGNGDRVVVAFPGSIVSYDTTDGLIETWRRDGGNEFMEVNTLDASRFVVRSLARVVSAEERIVDRSGSPLVLRVDGSVDDKETASLGFRDRRQTVEFSAEEVRILPARSH